MTKLTNEDLRKLTDQELKKLLGESAGSKVVQLLKLRSRESHEQKLYKQNKKLVAQIKTELNARELLNSSN